MAELVVLHAFGVRWLKRERLGHRTRKKKKVILGTYISWATPQVLEPRQTFQSVLRASERNPQVRPSEPPQEGGMLWKLGSPAWLPLNVPTRLLLNRSEPSGS